MTAAPASQPVTINPPPSAPAALQATDSQATDSQPAASQPAETQSGGARASAPKEERSHASRQSRRVTRRDTNRTSAPRRDWAATDTASAERYPERRDGGADDRTTGQRFWDNWQDRDRWQGRDANRESSWGRDRYDEYARGDGRRAVERSWRSDDRPLARQSRENVPVMAAPQFRFGW